MYVLTGFTLDDGGPAIVVAIFIYIVGGMSMNQMFRSFSFLMPDETSALSVSGMIMLFLIMFCGYVTSLATVPSYWVWVMYCNPVFYMFQVFPCHTHSQLLTLPCNPPLSKARDSN